MPTLWFIIVAVMLAAYVVLDGFDLGAGVIYLLVAHTGEERRMVLRAIGPVWDGNEVWLLATGGTLYFAFPQLYASSFSGFYLPLMMVLWLLMLRGLGIELRTHIDNSVWQGFFDVVFSGASALLPVFFGAALGNVDPRCTARSGWLLLRTPVDQLPDGLRPRDSRLVHGHGRPGGASEPDRARGALCGPQDRGGIGRAPRASWLSGCGRSS